MPSLRAHLQSGECGAKWVPPDSTEIVQEDEDQLLLRDVAAKVIWNVNSSPFPFALDAAHDEVLRADLEISARESFDNAWEPPAEGGGSARRRTEDPTWSPVIEQGRIDLPGGTALRLLRRTTYQPGNETVVGHVIVPTATGHLDFCAIARATFTGIRESIVMATMTKDRGSGPGTAEPDGEGITTESAEDAIVESFPPQSTYDDPGLDARFPEHPLTLVRQAIDKLREVVTITHAAPRDADVVHLEEPSCAFVAPPRYVPVPAEVLRMHPTLRVLMRLGIESWRCGLEVWRLDNMRFWRRDPRNELCALARNTIAEWAREGATDIKTKVEVITDFESRPQVQQSVSIKAGENPSRSIFRWWVEPDGVVFRLGSDGPPSIPDTEHVEILDAVQASWRRLDAVGPSRRPWWRIW